MAHFSWLDYTFFGVYLAASVGVGLLSARRSKSLGDYFLAGRGMPPFLVGMSILAALFSGISYLAGPAEVYQNGFGWGYASLAFFIATPITTIWMLPKFYQSRFFTAYQFLEERFSLQVRLLASGLFIFRVMLWLAAATYAPALALEKVTGIPLWMTILATGTLTTFYTALGGMRAVIWTDVMQLVVLFGGQLTILMVALSKIPGGFAGMWATNVADGRLALSTNFSLTEPVNLWSVLFAAAFLHLVQMSTDQVSVQRYLSAGSLKEAQRSLWIKLTFVLPVLVLFYGAGLVLYAFYKTHGDPLQAGLISRADQILPYFVVTQLPAGIPGLLIAAVYAASMSTISAGLNSLASATVVDFQQRLCKDKTPAGGDAQVAGARWITVGYGVLVIALAFAVSTMKSNLVESVNSIIGLVGGPLVGLFFVGMFTKRVDTRGALIGCLAGFTALVTLYLYQNGVFTKEVPPKLVSFIWFSLFGCLITMGVGVLTSRREREAKN
jgi:SSS family transporter